MSNSSDATAALEPRGTPAPPTRRRVPEAVREIESRSATASEATGVGGPEEGGRATEARGAEEEEGKATDARGAEEEEGKATDARGAEEEEGKGECVEEPETPPPRATPGPDKSEGGALRRRRRGAATTPVAVAPPPAAKEQPTTTTTTTTTTVAAYLDEAAESALDYADEAWHWTQVAWHARVRPAVTWERARRVVVAGAVVIAAAVAIVAVQVVWAALTAHTEFPLARRLPAVPCVEISEEAWRNGTVLDQRLDRVVAAMQRVVRAQDYWGLAASHIGVPICALTVPRTDGRSGAMTMLNARVTGQSTRRVRTREQSPLCPDQRVYAARFEQVQVRYRRGSDYEEWTELYEGPQAYALQKLLEAQQGEDHCE